jgi:hypothetical protein
MPSLKRVILERRARPVLEDQRRSQLLQRFDPLPDLVSSVVQVHNGFS